MSKLPSIITLAVIAALLAGCSGASELDSQPAATGTSLPSAIPTAEETPEPERTQPEKAPEPTPEPTPESSSEPPTAPVVEAPEEPAPDLEPLPAGPNTPFVPPPHGEPNPMPGNPYPDVPPGSPHQGNPNGEGVRSVAHPQPGFPGPGIGITPGVLRIGGNGYVPGEEIHILFAKPSTDYNLLSPNTGWPQAPVIAYAGPDGSYTFDIHISDELAPGKYGVMTWVPERGRQTPGEGEASKRFLDVTLVE